MGLESATFISELVNANPIGTDDRSTADDHMRLIKAVLQSTFPNATAAITPTPTEFNILDGAVVTTAELNRLQSYVGTINRALVSDSSGNIVVSPVTVAELNILDGLVSTTAELNRLQSYVAQSSRAVVSDGSGNLVVSLVTTTELNRLDGLTASATELNLTDGLLASTAELNTMNGILATTAELNRLQSFVGTASRAVVTDGSGNLVVSLVTTTELNRLDGMTASASELNRMDGILPSTAELNFVDGVTSLIQTQLNGKAPNAHSHTGAEISDLAAGDTTSGTFLLARIPTIDQAKLGSAAVGQGELKTATHTISTTSTAFVNIALTGGQYTLGQQHRNTSASNYAVHIKDFTSPNQTSYTSSYAIRITSSGTCQVQPRYVQASPPYDLGNGEILLFVYATIDNTTKKVISLSLSPDPIWAHNGPTSIIPQRIDAVTGIQYRSERDLAGIETLEEAKVRGGSALVERAALIKTAPMVEFEITQAIKNADMELIPHPFVHNENIGLTVVMLDPMSPIMEDLLMLHEDGEDVVGLFHDGFINIGNDNLSRGGPTDLQVPSITWKTA